VGDDSLALVILESLVKLEYMVNGVSIKSTKIHEQDSRFLSIKLVCETLGTRHAGSKGNKCNGIDAIFEVDEAAKMASDISDDCSTGADHEDRNNKSWISIGQRCKTRGMH